MAKKIFEREQRRYPISRGLVHVIDHYTMYNLGWEKLVSIKWRYYMEHACFSVSTCVSTCT